MKRSLISEVQRQRAATSAALVSLVIGRQSGVDWQDILSRKRGGNLPWLRRLAMYICVIELRCAKRAVAHAFGCSRSLVIKACQAIEDERDSTETDYKIRELMNEICPVQGGHPRRYG